MADRAIFETAADAEQGPVLVIIQPKDRIRALEDILPTEIGELFRANIEAVIEMYKSGELGPLKPGNPPVYLVDGKRVDKNPWEDDQISPDATLWCEVFFFFFLSLPLNNF